MNDETNCNGFQELLDRLEQGTLPEGGLRRLRAHAAECEDCAGLLSLQERLASPSRTELEAAIPHEMIADIWRSVDRELKNGDEGRRAHPLRRERWLVPTLGAAVALLVLASSLLLGELRRLRDREDDLHRRLDRQERLLGESSRLALAPVLLQDGERAARPRWERLLAHRRELSPGELIEWLGKLPADTRLLTPGEIERVAANMPAREARAWRRGLTGVDTSDGLQARELVRLLGALDPGERSP